MSNLAALVLIATTLGCAGTTPATGGHPENERAPSRHTDGEQVISDDSSLCQQRAGSCGRGCR